MGEAGAGDVREAVAGPSDSIDAFGSDAPIVFRGLCAAWPALQWDASALIAAMPDVRVSRSASGTFPNDGGRECPGGVMRMREFLQNLPSSPPYLYCHGNVLPDDLAADAPVRHCRTENASHLTPDSVRECSPPPEAAPVARVALAHRGCQRGALARLASLVRRPERWALARAQVPPLLRGCAVARTSLWISAAGASSPLHYDLPNVLLCQAHRASLYTTTVTTPCTPPTTLPSPLHYDPPNVLFCHAHARACLCRR